MPFCPIAVSFFGFHARFERASASGNTGTPAEYIYVIFEDVAPSDWAGAGKLFGETPTA